jgi:hypothetical protein
LERTFKSASLKRVALRSGIQALIKDKLSDEIVKAIDTASGAKLAAAKKAKRKEAVSKDRQNAERLVRKTRARKRRFAPFQPLENQLSRDEASFGDELMEIVLRELLAKHGVPFTHEAAGAFYRELGPEVLRALKSTMTHTTVDNAVLEAQAFFDERVAKGVIRKQQGSLRVARHRARSRISDKGNQPVDSLVEGTTGDRGLSDDSTE